MKILITGKNSFVGAGFKKLSQFRDVEEISLYDNRPEDIDFRNIDVVLHLAAVVHQKKKIPEHLYYDINRDLCLRTARCAKNAGVKHFVFLSTVKVYGESAGNVIRTEDSPCHPNDPYGKSKYEAEQALHEIEDSDFTVSVIRSPVVYGEGVKANILSIIKLIDHFYFLPLGKIANKRSFVYLGNLVAYIDAIIGRREPGTFIASDDASLSTTELVEMISNELGKRNIIFPLPKIGVKCTNIIFPGLSGRLFGSLEFDNTETKKKLSFKPPYSAIEGMRETVYAYKRNFNR